MSPRPDDEHMSVPVWRMRQLQDVEHAARECVELLKTGRGTHGAIERKVLDLLTEALSDD